MEPSALQSLVPWSFPPEVSLAEPELNWSRLRPAFETGKALKQRPSKFMGYPP